MALNFPNSPTNGQIYENYIYNATVGTWQLVSIDNIYTGAVIDTTPPGSPVAGDMWWDSDDGKLFIYYNDGTSSQWVNASGPSVAVQDTAPAGYEGQLWLDSTDGSMYVYYTDPGGTNSQWIGAVSNNNTAGNIIQVVSTTKTDTFSMTAEDTWTDITGLSVVITPSSASSKVSLRVDLGHVDSSVLAGLVFRFVRDSTPIGIGTDAGSRIAGTFGLIADTPGRGVTASGSFVDSPSSTSAITYKLQMYSQDTATTLINRRSADTDSTGFLRTVSTITAMEVAG